MGEIRNRMEADLRIRNLQPSTRDCYLRCVRRFAAYHMRSPDEMGREEVREYLSYLHEERKLHPKTIATSVAALRFLYIHTLERPDAVGRWHSPRIPKRLPVVLSRSEVATLLNAIRSSKYRTLAMTMYGAGMRVSEACRLQPDDVDAESGLLRVREGKGGRERHAMLSPRLLEQLRAYWREVRPPGPYLFPGLNPKRPVHPRSVQRALRSAAQSCGMARRVTPHTLRHYPDHRIIPSRLDRGSGVAQLGGACRGIIKDCPGRRGACHWVGSGSV